MTDHLGLRLTESDLDRLIAWRMQHMASPDPNRTPEQRASEFRRLLAIVLLPFALVAACALVALALA
ncbi:MAG: hypothetical protein RJA55_2330 [Acidobacteriota bacterium]|jgi:hypothetical protein